MDLSETFLARQHGLLRAKLKRPPKESVDGKTGIESPGDRYFSMALQVSGGQAMHYLNQRLKM